MLLPRLNLVNSLIPVVYTGPIAAFTWGQKVYDFDVTFDPRDTYCCRRALFVLVIDWVTEKALMGLCRGYMWNKIISKIFQRFISHVTTFETEITLFQSLKEVENYFKIISATMNMLENIHELQ